MQNKPSAAELVGAVRSFLEQDAMPRLEGRAAFHARVAVNALAIVERELDAGPGAAAEEHARLQEMLGRDGTLDELNRELARRIRSRDLDPSDAALRQHLWETTLETVGVDQPRYSRYRREMERRKRG